MVRHVCVSLLLVAMVDDVNGGGGVCPGAYRGLANDGWEHRAVDLAANTS